MPGSAAVSRLSFRAIFCSVFVCILISPTVVAQTANTQFDALVCSGNSSNASMTITTPQSDRVVNYSPVSIQGSVYNISQIEIYVDAEYAGTVAVPAHQSTFTASQGLTEGTHTLRLVGNDVCQFQDVTVDLVVTYVPDAPPPTLVDEGVVVTGPQTVTPANQAPQTPSVEQRSSRLENLPVVGPIVPALRAFARAVDFDATARDGGLGVALIRAGAFTLGLWMLLFAGGLVRFIYSLAVRLPASHPLPRQLGLQGPQMRTRYHWWKAGIHIGGLCLVVVAFVV